MHSTCGDSLFPAIIRSGGYDTRATSYYDQSTDSSATLFGQEPDCQSADAIVVQSGLQ